MPTPLGNRKSKDDGRDWMGNLVVFGIPILVATLLVALAFYPSASVWISDAAQAEFVGVTNPSMLDSEPVPKPRVLHAAK